MRLTYHPDAKAELIAAVRFYEGRVPTFGDQFLEAVEAAINEIQKTPERWRVLESGVRRYLMGHFSLRDR